MAIDRWMLDQLEAGGPATLRLYRWSRPTLSLGRHQQRLEPHWPALVEEGLIDLVRRPSGGRAVLHSGELTYALACRREGVQRERAYRDSCQWLLRCFAQAGQPLDFGASPGRQAQASGSCFATATAADLVQANGAKRIGSAQLWRGPLLLQHGSLLLEPPPSLWRRVFGGDPPALQPLPWGSAELMRQLRRSAEAELCPGGLEPQALTPAEWAAIEALRA